MLRYFSPIKMGKNRGDATITLILAIILISGVFLTGGILPHMEEETLNKEATSVVQGVRSEDSDGQSLIAAAGSSSDSKKTLQMKQLILATVTPTPTGTPIPTPTPTPISTTSSEGIWTITYTKISCGSLEPGVIGETGTIEITGTMIGYMALEMETGGVFATIQTSSFTPTTNGYTAKLPNSRGFNTLNWRIRSYSGGTYNAVDKSWSGGTFRANYDGQSTGC